MRKNKLFILILFFILVTNVFNILPVIVNDNSTISATSTWYTGWNYRKQITVDKTKVTGVLVNFPVLVRIQSSDFIGHAQSDGDDFLFTDDNTTKMAYEIEKYNFGTGELLAWVRMNISQNVNKIFYVYYGNTAASHQQNPKNVWDSNYKQVYHFNRSVGTMNDSTSNYLNGTVTGTTFNNSCKIDGGRNFDGNADSIDFTDYILASRTIECWVNFTTMTAGDIAFLFWNTPSPTTYSMMLAGDTNKIDFYVSGVNYKYSASVKNWYHAVIAYDNSTKEYNIYVNGNLKKTGTAGTAYSSKQMYLGYTDFNCLSGVIDEFRVSNSVRNISWVNTSFQNQNNMSGFISVSSESSSGVVPSFSISSVQPVNNSIVVLVPPPVCGATVTESLGKNFNVSLYENHTGSWVLQKQYINALDGFFSFTYGNVSSFSKKYYWRICVNNASWWSNNTYDFTICAKPSNIRSDGSHLFMTMEDRVKPYWYSKRGIHTIDYNNTIEGRYSLHITCDGTAGALTERFRYANYIKPDSWSCRIIINSSTNDDYTGIYLRDNIGASICNMIFLKNKQIRISTTSTYYFAMNWNFDTIYTILFSNIDYSLETFSATIYNATSSETINNIPFSFSPEDRKIVEFALHGASATTTDIYIDDWTVGTQANISTDALPLTYPVSSSVINETQATITGIIVNDGSPLQNSSQSNHTIKLFYDTKKHNDTYTYYFNGYSTKTKWLLFPENIIDSSENTIGGTGYAVPAYWIQKLTNHTGNTTGIISGNISKIEVRAKTWLTDNNFNGKIYLQPIYNNVNKTKYNTFPRYTDPTKYLWSDWIDITQDINNSHPDLNDITKLKCNLTADFSYVGDEGAWCSMVQLRITVNRTRDYAHNKMTIGIGHTGDTIIQTIKGLTPGQVYFYRNYINTSYTNSSSYSYGDEHYFLTKAFNCTAPKETPITELSVNLSWTKGTGANTTVLISNSNHWPNTPYDGTEIYNGTGSYYHHTLIYEMPNYVRAWSYNNWTVNPTLWHYSDNYTEFTWSIIGFNVFNESNPTQPISPFSLEMTMPDASFSYYATGCTNTHYVNITNITTGTVYIWIRADGYKTSPYVENVQQNTIYNKTYKLAPSTTSTGGGNEDCTLRSATDSIAISNHTVDAVIPLQHELDEIISVEIYNQSLYGTYGGWLMISSSNYTTTTTEVTIDDGVLDKNTTMARVTYYWWYCPGQAIETPIYYLRVVETIETEYTEVDRGVEDALVKILRLNNFTSKYEIVRSLYTDANGYVNVYLIPEVTYNINITKNSYYSESSWYTPASPNEWGQTTEKIFRLVRIEEETDYTPVETVYTNIVYSVEPLSTRHHGEFTLWYNITSSDSKLEWYSMRVYFYNTTLNMWVSIFYQNNTDASGGSISYTVGNITGRYSIECWFKKQGYAAQEIGETGSFIHFITYLKEGVSGIPDYAYYIILIVIMIVIMGFFYKYFGSGIITGYVGLGVFAIGLMFNDVSISLGGTGEPISAWLIWGITFLMYTIGVFLWSKI